MSIFNTTRLLEGRFDKDNASVNSFAISLGINTGIMLLLVTVFLTLRAIKIKGLPLMFNCRRYFNTRTKGIKHAHTRIPYVRVPMYDSFDKKELGNRRWPRGSLSWLWPIFGGYRIKKIVHTHGVDAAMYLIWLRNLFIFAVCLAGPGMTIILPINATGSNQDLATDDDNYVTGMGIITIGNLPPMDPKLAAHIVMTYIFSILAYVLIYCTYWEYTKLRRKYFRRNCARAYTVMVEEVPKQWRTDKGLKKFFQAIVPAKVTAAHIAWQTDKVRKYHDKRQKYIFEYESNENQRNKKTICWNCCPWFSCCPGGEYGDENPTTTTGYCGCCRGVPKIGDKVDALPYYKGKVKKYEAKLRGVQENPRGELHRAPVGFVSFESTFMARIAAYPFINTPLTLRAQNCCLTGMTLRPAPEPEDVYWENLNVYQLSFILRSLLITVIMLVLIAFWFVPTLLLTSVANVQYLSTIDGFGWLSGINDLPAALRGFVQGFLPTFTLFVIFQLVYPILKLVVLKLAGFHVKSSAYWLIFLIYWAFLIINILFVVTVGGSVISLIETVVDEPIAIIDLLATTLPQQSLFFLQYLMVAGLGRQVLSVFRILNLIKWIFGHIFASNKKQTNWATIPGDFEYPRAAAQDLLIFTIMIVYSVMAPLINVFGVIYFGLCYMTSKYNMLYANMPQWESGGRVWPLVYQLAMAALLLFQLTMLGLLAVKGSAGTPALIAPPLITVLFWILLDRNWKIPSQYGPVGECDAENLRWQEEFGNNYIDPSLRSDLWRPYPFDGPDEEEGEYVPPPMNIGNGDEDVSDTSSDEEGKEKDSEYETEEEEEEEAKESSTTTSEDEGNNHRSTSGLIGDSSEIELEPMGKKKKQKKRKKKQREDSTILDV